MRWTIEEFFRTLKTAGFDIEEADIGDPKVMIKFVAAATVAAVTIMQLVSARDGTTDQQLAEAFDPDDQPVLEALSPQLEGSDRSGKRTRIQKIAAFAAWVIARLGGWTALLWQARSQGDAPEASRLPPHQIRHHAEAQKCVNRIAGDQDLFVTISALLSANLTPTLRRQDHTTSPSALASPVSRAKASTASCPDVRDVAKRPSKWGRRRRI